MNGQVLDQRQYNEHGDDGRLISGFWNGDVQGGFGDFCPILENHLRIN